MEFLLLLYFANEKQIKDHLRFAEIAFRFLLSAAEPGEALVAFSGSLRSFPEDNTK
jgi:hypothetical protein